MSDAEFSNWLDSLEPFTLTPEEEAEAEAWMKKCGYMTKEQEQALIELFP